MKWEKFDIKKLTGEEYRKWYSLMSIEKQNRVEKFRFTDDKKRSVAGEMLARKMLSQFCNKDPESFEFKLNEYGKPYICETDIHFNISHSGDFVVCAIDTKPIGIDIEKIRNYKPSVAKKFCTDDEITFIEQSANPAEEFTRLWTKKEAYAKYLGTGLKEDSLKRDISGTFFQYEFDDYYVTVFQE